MPEEEKHAKKPWRLSWVVIAILVYILLQTIYMIFSGERSVNGEQ